MQDIRDAAMRIARQFHPRRITLFGSYAYGNPNQDSDVDLLVLMDGRRPIQKAIQIRETVNFAFPVDLIVRAPHEFQRRISWGDLFLTEIQEKGRILYEASHQAASESCAS